MGDSSDTTIAPETNFRAKSDAFNARQLNADNLDYLLQKIGRALGHRPGLEVTTTDDSVTILRVTAQGPDISVHVDSGRCSLSIGGWHDDVTPDIATDYVRRAIDGSIRVRIDRLGGKPWRCALEVRADDGSWLEESAVVYPRFTFWPRQKTSEYLSNAH